MHNHKPHSHCDHCLHACEKCDEAYCCKCSKKWTNCHQAHYPLTYLAPYTAPVQPYVPTYPWTTWWSEANTITTRASSTADTDTIYVAAEDNQGVRRVTGEWLLHDCAHGHGG